MTREFGRLVADAATRAEGSNTRERVVAMVVHGSRALAEDPLFERLLDVDPELLLPYVTQRLGGMQKMAVDAAARALGDGDGSVRTDASPEAVELIARGFVLASHGELGVDPWQELGRAVDGYLRP
jgi:hypothetical protein